ncbi:MAG: hypothetical protein HYY24_02160 [Verrucomicrobia bacterium]|nr:hypothetical protein [Verrucomicrobiota bacterium]
MNHLQTQPSAAAAGLLVGFALLLTASTVISQTDTLSLVLKGAWPAPLAGTVNLVRVVENRAYVAVTEKVDQFQTKAALRILDVSNPLQPVVLGSYEAHSGLRDIQLLGRYAYLLGLLGLEVVDVLAPSNTLLAANYPDGMEALDVANQYAYVAQGSRFDYQGFEGWMSILDVSHPAEPARVGGVFIPFYHPVTGDPLLRQEDEPDDGLLEGDPVAIKVVGNHAFVADTYYGLHVIDVSDAAEPVRVGGYRITPFGGSDMALEVVGQLVYLADSDTGLHVFDVRNPAQPVRIGGYYAGWGATALGVDGSNVFLARERGGLDVIDMSNPVRPVRLGTYLTNIVVADFQLVGANVFVAAGKDGLQIFERTTAAQAPVTLGMRCTNGAWRLEWPLSAQGFVVEFAPTLKPPVQWTVVEGSALSELDAKVMPIDPRGSSGFYRLRKL